MFDDYDLIVRHIGDLPSVPPIATRVMTLLQQPLASVKMLAAAIGQDPAMAARILRVANSSFYSQQREVATLDRAIVVLGEDYTRNLIFAACLRITAGAFTPLQANIWEDSLGCAVGARLIADETGAANPEEAFLAGLFRHIGKLVMINHDAERYQNVLDICSRGEGSLIDTERALFAYSHEKVGAAVLDHWNFPETLVQSALHHHRVSDLSASDPPIRSMVATVDLAGRFCHNLGIARPAPDLDRDLAHAAGAGVLDLSGTQVYSLLDTFRTCWEKEKNGFNATL